MNKFIKVALTRCQYQLYVNRNLVISKNRDRLCYDTCAPAVSVSKIIGGCCLLHSKSLTKSANTGFSA